MRVRMYAFAYVHVYIYIYNYICKVCIYMNNIDIYIHRCVNIWVFPKNGGFPQQTHGFFLLKMITPWPGRKDQAPSR